MKVAEFLDHYKPFYLNNVQSIFLTAVQKFKVWVGGRGSGKTNIEAITINSNMQALPASKGLMYGKDLTQMKTKEIVELQDVWKRLGMVEKTKNHPMGDYVIGIRPPEGFKVVNKYKDWSNVVSFPDGCTIEMISENQRANRGGSYDYGFVVEASLLNEQEYWSDIFPMVRGLKGKHKKKEYLSWNIFSNMPWLETNYWVPDLSKKAKAMPNKYFYIESTIYDNVDVFGAEYIEDVKNNFISNDEEAFWLVEYMNERNVMVRNPFYAKFSENKHTYRNTDYTDPMYNPLKELIVSFDFNNLFNSCNVGQKANGVRSIQKEFYTYSYEQYTLLAEYIHRYYSSVAYHINRTIIIDGDQDGNDRIDQNGKSFFDNLRTKLIEFGWTVKIRKTELMRNPSHLVKHFQINEVLKEYNDNWIRIRINSDECPYTIISIKNAKRTKDGKKDKTSENKLQGEDRKFATDLSDAFDYAIYQDIAPMFTNFNSDFGIEAM